MARKRNSNRSEAMKNWLESGGKITTKELAAAYGVPEYTIRKWKSIDKWQQELDTKKRGGQRGNKNAAGHGAPKGNNNAETHGAYSTIHLDNLSPEERAYIESLTVDTESAMLREFQLLMAKERDLVRKIKEYENAAPDSLYVDRVVEMLVPQNNERLKNNRERLEALIIERDELVWEMESNEGANKRSQAKLDKLESQIEELRDKVGDTDSNDNPLQKLNMTTVMKSSPFERTMKLEAEYNKLHGRILKLIDSMRAYGIDTKRLDLDERKHTLAKQRLSGEFDIDPTTGELNDTESAEDADIDL